MGLKTREGQGGNTKYLKIISGGIWDTKNLDTEDPNYKEETYEFAGKEGVRKGCCYNELEGMFDSVHFKDGDYGEFMDVYVDDIEEDQKYNISFKIDDGYTNTTIAKRMIIALMSFDKSKPISINVIGSKTESGFVDTTLWVSQGGKSLVLNPNQDPQYFNESKHVAMPDKVKEVLDTIDFSTAEERKEMSKKQKAKARERELEEVIDVFKEIYLENLNAGSEGSKGEKPQPVQDEEVTREEKPPVVEKETAAKKTLSREERLTKLKAMANR